MTKLSVLKPRNTDSHIGDYLHSFIRRVEATPPGTCPLTVQLAMLQTSALQTCGKCVPCRDGLPQLVAMLEQIVACEADESVLEKLTVQAEMIRDTSDCAIGYEAAAYLLQSIDSFADEYQSHLTNRACTEAISQTVPCESFCPAHIDIPAYIALAAVGDYSGAVNMIRKDNPFPTACALVCEHPCEDRCRRALIDAPINIRGIKKFIVDQMPVDQVKTPMPSARTNRRIAVIGGGPSGLTCAYFLALMGHGVVLYEKRSRLGGMLRYGIPAYRLPRERLDQDIAAILSAGDITVEMNTEIGEADLQRISEEFDAFYVSIGAHSGNSLSLENAAATEVMSAVELLGAIGDEDYPDFSGKNVVVIGGGNVAMDCARTAVRAGADQVSVVYRRRMEDMTALALEIESAVAEGVEMLTLESPVGIEVDEADGRPYLITQPQMIGSVSRGRPAPVNAAKPPNKVSADIVLVAVGQAVESAPFEEYGMEANRGCFTANDHLEATGFTNIFTGGDCQTGPSTAIRAIGAGKVAARNIDEFLGYHHLLDCGVGAPEPVANDRTPKGRVEITERPARERRNDFEYVENPMSFEEAQQECGRCLRCDHYGCGVLEQGRVQYA